MALDPDGAEDAYRQNGRDNRDTIIRLLPGDWSFDGKRVLEFGCGAGRVLSAFADEAGRAEFHGCDVDAESVRWAQEHLVPPFHVFSNAGEPALPFEDDSLDLIYAISVFSHLADGWSEWLAELHRCLSPDGYLMVTLLGESASETIAGEPWDPDRVGMNVLYPEQPWDRGGPMVFISRWWLEARWGRAFELADYVTAVLPIHQDWAVLRKKPVEATAALFDEPEPGEPREVEALRHNVSQLRRELRAQEDERSAYRAGVEGSLSWRMTRPLRAVKRFVQSPRGHGRARNRQ